MFCDRSVVLFPQPDDAAGLAWDHPLRSRSSYAYRVCWIDLDELNFRHCTRIIFVCCVARLGGRGEIFSMGPDFLFIVGIFCQCLLFLGGSNWAARDGPFTREHRRKIRALDASA